VLWLLAGVRDAFFEKVGDQAWSLYERYVASGPPLPPKKPFAEIETGGIDKLTLAPTPPVRTRTKRPESDPLSELGRALGLW
jgi:hypothetical protein